MMLNRFVDNVKIKLLYVLIAFSIVFMAFVAYELVSFKQQMIASIYEVDNKIDRYNNESALKITSVGAKIDLLDKSTNQNSKKRELIIAVRKAIVKNSESHVDIRVAGKIAAAVVESSYTYNLSISKILAQIKAESNFNTQALSKSNAKGLMQVLDSTADEIAVDLGKNKYDIWDVDTNINFGSYYMYKMLKRFNNDYINALRAYNFGPNNVDKVKSGIMDFSILKSVKENNNTNIYLVDRYGRYIMGKNNNKIKIRDEVPDEFKYPVETQNYINKITLYDTKFSEFGLDKEN